MTLNKWTCEKLSTPFAKKSHFIGCVFFSVVNFSVTGLWVFILFCENCRVADRAAVVQVLEVQEQSFEERYLGLPTPNGRMSKDRLQNLQQKYMKRMIDWDGSQLA